MILGGLLIGIFNCKIIVYNHLTPNRPLVHTSFTYPKLNMDGFSLLNGSLGYVDSTQEVEWNSLHAERGIRKGKGSGIMHIRYIKLSFWGKISQTSLVQWLPHWHLDLKVPSSIPVWGKLFSFKITYFLHQNVIFQVNKYI